LNNTEKNYCDAAGKRCADTNEATLLARPI